MSMGEAILASAAGAVIGSWIGSKLFNNPNYQDTRKAGYKSPAVYNKSMSSFGNRNSSPLGRTSPTTATTTTTKKSGFFGSKGSSTTTTGTTATTGTTSSSSRFGG